MQYKILPPPIQGLNFRDHTAYLGDFQALTLHNFYVKNTKIIKRLGYRQLGLTLATDEIGMELVNFIDGSGASHIFAFTDKYVREYNSDTNVWDIKNPVVPAASTIDAWATSTAYVRYNYVRLLMVVQRQFIVVGTITHLESLLTILIIGQK